MNGTASSAGSKPVPSWSMTEVIRSGHTRRAIHQVAYSLGCSLLMSVWALAGGNRFGTQRWEFHVTAIALYIVYRAVLCRERKSGGGWKDDLSMPAKQQFMWGFMILGAASGLLRVVSYPITGCAGLGFYSSAFGPLLAADNLPELVLRWFGFAVVLYGAVLLPGLLFCGVIQDSFCQVGLLWPGIVIQALVFGLVHLQMNGPINIVYGIEAGVGGVVYGTGYHYGKSLHPPALFLWTNVLVCTLLYRSYGC